MKCKWVLNWEQRNIVECGVETGSDDPYCPEHRALIEQRIPKPLEGDRNFAELQTSGLLWWINRNLFHPRGFALALIFDKNIGSEPICWQLLGDGIEPWTMGDTDEEAKDYLARVNELLRPKP
jgi:hypothetical protein